MNAPNPVLREWRGRVPTEKGAAYLQFLRDKGIQDFCATSGHRGTWTLVDKGTQVTEFVLLTLWESRDHIRAFAGDDIRIARYYPEDPDFLLEMSPHVRHYEIMEQAMKNQHPLPWLERLLFGDGPVKPSKPVVRIAGLR